MRKRKDFFFKRKIKKMNIMQAVSKIKAALNGSKGSRIADLEMMVDFTHTGDFGK